MGPPADGGRLVTPRRVLVTGATGVLGRRVVPRLVSAGHEVTGVARSEAKADTLRDAGATPAQVDLFDPWSVRDAVAGHEAVLHLATSIPPTSRMALPRAWEENERLRREASAHLVDAALATGVVRYVQESIAFMYADGGDRWLDEDAELDATAMYGASVHAEGEADRFTDAGGDGVALRFGQFIAPDSVHMQDLAAMTRRGVLPLVGDHHGYEAFVHADDAADAVVAVLDVPAGVYNVTEDEPMTRADHAETIGDILGRKVRLPPQIIGKAPLLDLRARSLRVSNRRFRGSTHWRPTHGSTRSSWEDLFAHVG